jgi:hypothetical protein
MGRSWAHHTGDDSMIAFAKNRLSSPDITWMSFRYGSLTAVLWLIAILFQCYRENKKPCLLAVSRV